MLALNLSFFLTQRQAHYVLFKSLFLFNMQTKTMKAHIIDIILVPPNKSLLR
jgi:hypothetical protein